jgi:hypothetical protein
MVVGAVVAFVLLVSLQALHEWPVAGLSFPGAAETDVGNGHAVSPPANARAARSKASSSGGPSISRASVAGGASGAANSPSRPLHAAAKDGGGTAASAGGIGTASPASPKAAVRRPAEDAPSSVEPAPPAAPTHTTETQGGSATANSGGSNIAGERTGTSRLPAITGRVTRSLGIDPSSDGEPIPSVPIPTAPTGSPESDNGPGLFEGEEGCKEGDAHGSIPTGDFDHRPSSVSPTFGSAPPAPPIASAADEHGWGSAPDGGETDRAH